MDPTASTIIAILAGGRSRRMGRDKTAVIVHGESMLERTARTTLGTGLPVLVVGRACPEEWPLDNVEFIPDAVGDQGPLGGLLTALSHAGGRSVLLLACDLPKMTTEALTWLIEMASHTNGHHGLIVDNGGRGEPLFSLYNANCIPLAQARIASNRLSMNGLIDAGQFAHIAAPEWVAEQLLNLNTPEDLRAFDQSEITNPGSSPR